ncbi:hypothetical protein T12_6611 [Trichinella patagoniensis]|uniref:Uncharacterized protein n=1 Tax=Trichinella patagoniensis TaxID=990121 RepID=A0A0V0YS86_9BILA|nr:hypothetical protein T12_6611 [Trichinella patagoniensis]
MCCSVVWCKDVVALSISTSYPLFFGHRRFSESNCLNHYLSY